MRARAQPVAFAPATAVHFQPVCHHRTSVNACTQESPARPVPRKLAKPEESGTAADVGGAYSLGETLRQSPALNSSKMNAMRDYFGDDGREVQDYTKRPRNANGAPMFRVLLVGSGDRELETAKALADSGIVTGLYYCPDEPRVCDIKFTPFATSTGVSAFEDPAEVVRFAKWALCDAVFVGPDRKGCVDKEVEKALAAAGVTVFPHDVSAMIADDALSVSDCLSSIAESAESQTAEQLVE